MRWLLTSWGSSGDLHPFLSLGRALIERGHQVTLVGHPSWGAETEVAGLRFVSTGEPLRETFIRDTPEIFSRKWVGLVSLHALVNKAIAPSFDYFTKALLAEAPHHDVMVAHHFTFPAPLVAELTGIPWATVSLAPGVIPSAHTRPGADMGRSGNGLLSRQKNRLIWFVGGRLTRRMVDPVINQLRAAHGLSPARDVVFKAHSPVLNLQLYSSHFAARPPDWSEEKKIAGFCFYDPPNAPELSPEIEQFLRNGEKPVLFTLGSTAVQNPGLFYHHAVKALQALGLRGILLYGPDANRFSNLPTTVLAVPYAPYGPLMPHVKAVAHQCGIGTLSHTLRAGVPSVACPFAFDQPNNARRLETLGVAEVLLPGQHQPGHIEKALRRLLAGDASQRATRLGELIRAENGPVRACEFLEETFTRSHS